MKGFMQMVGDLGFRVDGFDRVYIFFLVYGKELGKLEYGREGLLGWG